MNEKIIEPSTFVAAMQDILTAPSPGSLLRAVHNVNAHLTVLPVEQVLAQSGQFLSLAEQYLMDAVENGMGEVSERTRRECGTAYHDWLLLRRPILPMPLLTAAAQSLLWKAENICILEEYAVARQGMWAQLHALDDGEQEAVSGHISRQLAALLIRKVLPELVCQRQDPVLNRQYDLWTQLSDCRRHGLDTLAPYFLHARQNCVRVLLPPAMPFQDDAGACCSCARMLAILYHQIPVCQWEELFRCLHEELTDVVTDGVLDGRSDETTETIRSLYLAVHTAQETGHRNYWDSICYMKHTIHEEVN